MSCDTQSPSSRPVAVHQETVITVGDIDYLLVLNPDNFLEKAGFDATSPTLALVYTAHPGEYITGIVLRSFRDDILDGDDVFQLAFAANLVFYGSYQSNIAIDPDAVKGVESWNVKRHFVLERDEPGLAHSVAPGPPTKKRPLAGVRIGVKDNIDIAGHKTTLCNRSWMDLYPAKTKTAACIQTLIDAGAIIVGKLKLQAMIMREEPLECVEFTAPFNPRADGYQVPSGSSNGSGASIASYDWLDFAIGSDTNGSGRKPASYNGCFSIRPSTGIINTDGVVGYFPQFDMPVFFGRDVFRFMEFILAWYGASPMLRDPFAVGSTIESGEPMHALKVEILRPKDYLATSNPEQSEQIDKFIRGLEAALQISRQEVSLAEKWKKDCPDGQEHNNLATYLEEAGILPFYHDQYHNLEGFRNDYQLKFGRPPFVHRALHWQWDVGKKVSKEKRDELWRRSEVYRDWMLENVFKASSPDTVVVMPLPIETGQPNYRDAPLPDYSLLSGYAALNMSNMLGAPEVTAPVGAIPYLSTVTNKMEALPVAVSLIGAPGTDLILSDLVKKGLKGANIPTRVKVGSLMYEVD